MMFYTVYFFFLNRNSFSDDKDPEKGEQKKVLIFLDVLLAVLI